MSEVSPSFLSKAEVAARYGVSYRTVSRWIRNKGLPAIRVGQQVRIRVDDLASFEVPVPTLVAR